MPHSLVERLRRFREDYVPERAEHFRDLVARGQQSSLLFISRLNSRLVPDDFLKQQRGGRSHYHRAARSLQYMISGVDVDGGYACESDVHRVAEHVNIGDRNVILSQIDQWPPAARIRSN